MIRFLILIVLLAACEGPMGPLARKVNRVFRVSVAHAASRVSLS